MSVSINEKWGYFLMVLSLISKSVIGDDHEEAYGFTWSLQSGPLMEYI
jgi:hypothetical protein